MAVNNPYRAPSDAPDTYSVDLNTAKRYVVTVLKAMLDGGYYADAFGYACTREGSVDGYAGPDREAYAAVIGGPDLWPPGAHADKWDLAGLVRVVRFYYRDVAAPTRYLDHTAYGCGRHPRDFDVGLGRSTYRERVNAVLTRLEPPMHLTEQGDVITLVPAGLADILAAEQAGAVSGRYRAAIAAATAKFQAAGSPSDQKDAVRDLADLLEELRPDARRLFGRPDEAALFEIANRFAIRHRNQFQQTDYDGSVWMPWIFYWFLAAVHAVVTALDRETRT